MPARKLGGGAGGGGLRRYFNLAGGFLIS